MKRKFWFAILAIVASVCMAFGLASCNPDENLSGSTSDENLSGSNPDENLPGSEGLEFEFFEDEDCYVVAGIGTCTDTDIVIPSMYEGKPVIYIGERAFWRTEITSVVIPGSVTHIGTRAFSGCPYLESVKISKSVTTIERLTFAGSGITSIVIPKGVTEIGVDAFQGCSYLTSVEIPDSVTEIGSGAFRACVNLASVEIPEGVTTIGIETFYDCESLTSIVIPSSVTVIEGHAFLRCESLTSVHYKGAAEDWEKITIEEGNEALTSATFYYE